MTDGGQLVAISECWSCGRLFAFDPERVPSVWIDPITRQPPDMAPDSDDDFAARLARSVRQPICRSCMTAQNGRRLARGSDPIPVQPGAYVDDD